MDSMWVYIKSVSFINGVSYLKLFLWLLFLCNIEVLPELTCTRAESDFVYIIPAFLISVSVLEESSGMTSRTWCMQFWVVEVWLYSFRKLKINIIQW